jgi:hypothetical protein
LCSWRCCHSSWALTLLVPGDGGLGIHDPRGHAADEPVQIVFLLSISAVFLAPR